MLCQTAEDEGVQLAGEAGASHSLLPDNAPSGDTGELGGRGELPPPLTPCQPGSKHTRGEADEEKWDEAGNGCGWEEGS